MKAKSDHKKCRKCGMVFPANLTFFYSNGGGNLNPRCKPCKSEQNKCRYKANRERVIEKVTEYYERNKKSVLAYKHEYYVANRDAMRMRGKKRYEENHAAIRLRAKQRWASNIEENRRKQRDWYHRYYPENKKSWDESRKKRRLAGKRKYSPEYNKLYRSIRRRTDPAYDIKNRLRCRLRSVLASAGAIKSACTMDLVGCSTDELMSHLEKQFSPGMTWENRGAWHADHIRPCASYDLADPQQQRECFHFSNLQPLWKADNEAKGSVWKGKRWARKSGSKFEAANKAATQLISNFY